MSEKKRTIPNRPSPEGAQLGAVLAKLVDRAEPEIRKTYPKHAERCKSCAFRAGTFPNRCAATVLDALKMVIEPNGTFVCHQRLDEQGNPSELCAGWAIAQAFWRHSPDTTAKRVLVALSRQHELS